MCLGLWQARNVSQERQLEPLLEGGRTCRVQGLARYHTSEVYESGQANAQSPRSCSQLELRHWTMNEACMQQHVLCSPEVLYDQLLYVAVLLVQLPQQQQVS